MRTTETPRQADTPRGKNIFSPQDRFASAQQQRNLAIGFAVFILAFCVVFEYLTVHEMQVGAYVFAIDSGHTIHAGPLETLDEDDRLFKEVGLEAALVALSRSPAGSGMDFPQRAANVYRDVALDKLQTEITADLPEIKTKNLHWKPEVKEISVLANNAIHAHFVRVSGNIIVVGIYEGQSIVEPRKFSAIFSVIRNPRLDRVGEYPYIVADYKMSIQQAQP